MQPMLRPSKNNLPQHILLFQVGGSQGANQVFLYYPAIRYRPGDYQQNPNVW